MKRGKFNDADREHQLEKAQEMKQKKTCLETRVGGQREKVKGRIQGKRTKKRDD